MSGSAHATQRHAATKAVLAAFDPRRLTLCILPTEKCNFRCAYCYEDFSVGKMSASTANAVKALLDRRSSDLTSFAIRWFGGEPLMAKDVVLDISQHAAHIADERGIAYSASMTTNGYLLSAPLADQLISAGVTHYQISLDGPSQTHDQSRLRANGGGTFHRIWDNLLNLRDSDHDFQVVVRVHFSPQTTGPVHELVRQLDQTFGHDDRFKYLFKSVGRLGGPNDEAIQLFLKADELDAKRSLIECLSNPDRQVYDPGDYYICYAAKPNELVIRSDGRISKCTVALNDDRNLLGSLSKDGTINVDNAKLAQWMAGFEKLDFATLACPLKKLPRNT